MTPLIVDPFLHFLTVMSELHQKELMSKQDLHCLPHQNIARFSSRHWLDFLVRCQSSKSSVVCARTFDALKRYSVTEFGKDKEKLAGMVKHLSYLLEWKHVCLVQPAICSIHVAVKVRMRTID